MRAARSSKQRLSLADARANALKLNWSGNYRPPRPGFLGTRMFEDYPIAELADYIDWTPFFSTWELTGKFPAILDDAKYGAAARSLYDDAQAMLRADRVGALVPGERGGRLLAGEFRRRRYPESMPTRRARQPLATLHTLRQQLTRREGRANVALADFVAPRTSGLADYIGAFMVTAGIGEDEVADRFKHANDDYSAIMVKALADRLAEAFAERLHQRVRKEFWGYAPDETLRNGELIAETYQGIRPAPGYPAQPDHTEKATLFRLLDGGAAIGVKLTESFAMWPGASVCGLYFSHPESHYFGVGKIERDQVEDYASAQGLDDRGSGALARADPQLRSAGGGQNGRGVTPKKPDTGEGVLRCLKFSPLCETWNLASSLGTRTQNAPIRIAPTNANTANTASTSSRKARSTSHSFVGLNWTKRSRTA